MKICDEYIVSVRDAGLIDFDDMIMSCRDIFYKHESILRKWQKKYRYFLVDEFQDINEAQYDILRLLAGDAKNVFAVGDDDQSIYAFRGANPQLMQKFLQQYPGCKQVILTMNYRCSERVIGAADTLVRHNTDRIERPMQKHLPDAKGGEVVIVKSENTDIQATFVCDMIEDLMDRCSYNSGDFAILYRSDHCAVMFKKIAKMRGIAINAPGAVNLMTAHASKGLEFKCVFIIGLQEGLFPHHKSIDPDGVPEERRLMYVAMTRAKERLYLCGLGTKNGKRVSRFIAESSKKKRYITDTVRLVRI